MTWALDQQLVTDSSARHVLLCLANYADKAGRNAFPSTQSLAEDTGLSERTVRYKLDVLLDAGAIRPGNQAIARAHIERRDRTPVCYDLVMTRGAVSAPRNDEPGQGGAGCNICTSLECTGCNPQQNGVQSVQERGAESAPKPSLNHHRTEEQQAQVDAWGRFAMFESWQPAADELAPFLRLAMLSESVDEPTLNSFIAHFLTLPQTVENSKGWCKRLAKWAKNQHATTLGASHAPNSRGGAAPVGPSVEDNLTDLSWLQGADPVQPD